MPVRDLGRLRSYVGRITRSVGGIESVAASVPPVEADAAPFSALETAQEPGVSPSPGATGRKAPVTPELAKAAKSAAEKLARGERELTTLESFATEALIIPDRRPAFDVVDGDFVADHADWGFLTADEAVHTRLRAAIPSVGRIELPGQRRIPYGGTGFVVGPGLVMTNRHVAEIFAAGIGVKHLRFRDGWRSAVDFKGERNRPDGPDLEVRRVLLIHPWWDMALLEVPDLATTATPLRLAVRDGRDLAGHRIAVIGYPARDPLRNDPVVQDKLFDRVFQVKRVQPGEIDGAIKTASYGKLVDAASHDCSTLGGNSGSAIIDLDTGEVLGLHFGGRYLDTNYAVPSYELARDPRVVQAGVSLAGPAPGGPSPAWLRTWDHIESVAGEPEAGPAPKSDGTVTDPPSHDSQAVRPTGGRMIFEVPLRITVELGAQPTAGAGETTVVATSETSERMLEPRHDTDYRGRGGYDADFLERIRVPMPHPRHPAILARLKSGGTRLDYQNFSILVHAERRLAMITAANVTTEPRLRRPEPGRDYSRKGLGGLGKNDIERWFEDPRLDSRFQLPDVFFTRDDGAFDKGHVVRRDDVAWGRDYMSVVRGNGDTFHVTNCSPQVSQFNQSARGEDNWGDLENHVLKEASEERLCVFAGPVLDPADETFVGRGPRGQTLRVRIPSRYWKVVVAPTDEGLAVYGFVLEQDLSGVELEFAVPYNFRRLHVPLSAIEDATGVDFGDLLREADSWSSETSQELAERSDIIRTESLGSLEIERVTPNVGDDEDADDDHDDRTSPHRDTEAPANWRVAKALLTLRRQVDARSPRRSKVSDGSIGDAAHATRDSDHNPWVRDGGMGVVTAIDITHDPAGGCDAGTLAEALVESRDPRVKYIIFNRRIVNSAAIDGTAAWTWRAYRGRNAHTKHVHISVRPDKTAYDGESPWRI